MKIRKIIYVIDYIHILTFKDKYREIIAPHFAHENLKYSIENENSLNETIKLIYSIEGCAIIVQKSGISFIYEGDVAKLKNHPILEIFFLIYKGIKTISGYTTTKRQKLNIIGVDLLKPEKVNEILKHPSFVHNPFGTSQELAAIIEFQQGARTCRIEYGNFNDSDIQRRDISPMNTEYNSELVDSVGLMIDFNLTEENIDDSNLGTFKAFLADGQELINKYISSLPK